MWCLMYGSYVDEMENALACYKDALACYECDCGQAISFERLEHLIADSKEVSITNERRAEDQADHDERQVRASTSSSSSSSPSLASGAAGLDLEIE